MAAEIDSTGKMKYLFFNQYDYIMREIGIMAVGLRVKQSRNCMFSDH